MKRIDIHLHLVYDGLSDNEHSDGAQMKQYLEEHDTVHGILMSCGEYNNPFETSAEKQAFINSTNLECCALANKYPETYSWMCNVDPEYSPETVYERIVHYKNLGAVGVGEFFYNYWLDNPKIMNVLEAAEKAKMPVLFHISPLQGFQYGIADDAGLPRLEKVLKSFSELIFIGHSQPFWYEIGGNMPTDLESRNSYPTGKVQNGGRLIELFDTYPNLYADLSANSAGNAIMRDPEFGYSFLEKYQDRLMYGTDMVNVNMNFPLYNFMEEAESKGYISSMAFEKICYKNAVKIFKLDI